MDKFILITGGTKGIGKAVASCLGKAGYNLILTYASDQATAEEVRSELVGRFDIQVSILRADISDRNTIGVIDSFLEENRLRLDGLVFNAGMTCRDPFEELSFEDWDRVFFANIHFPIFLLQKIVGRINKGKYRVYGFLDGNTASFGILGIWSDEKCCSCAGQKHGEVLSSL